LGFLTSLEPGRGSAAPVNVGEPVSALLSVGRLPSSTWASIHREVAAINKERYQEAQATVVAGVSLLERSGWKAKCEVALRSRAC